MNRRRHKVARSIGGVGNTIRSERRERDRPNHWERALRGGAEWHDGTHVDDALPRVRKISVSPTL
jgi:hypothetical protein